MTSMDQLTTEIATHTGWFKASYTTNANACVEVRYDGEHVHIRDSKYRRDLTNHPSQEPIITVTVGQWLAFLDELTGHAPAGANGALLVEDAAHRSTRLRTAGSGPSLTYTEKEWVAFLAGVHDHEFDRPTLTSTN